MNFYYQELMLCIRDSRDEDTQSSVYVLNTGEFTTPLLTTTCQGDEGAKQIKAYLEEHYLELVKKYPKNLWRNRK